MGIGLDPKQIMQEKRDLFVSIVGEYEKMYTGDQIPKSEYLDILKQSPPNAPIIEFYTRMFERGDLSKDEYTGILVERKRLIESKMTEEQAERNRKSRKYCPCQSH